MSKYPAILFSCWAAWIGAFAIAVVVELFWGWRWFAAVDRQHPNLFGQILFAGMLIILLTASARFAEWRAARELALILGILAIYSTCYEITQPWRWEDHWIKFLYSGDRLDSFTILNHEGWGCRLVAKAHGLPWPVWNFLSNADARGDWIYTMYRIVCLGYPIALLLKLRRARNGNQW